MSVCANWNVRPHQCRNNVELTYERSILHPTPPTSSLGQQCLKILPYVGGIILFLIIAFAVWVRSVPPKVVSPPEFKITPEMLQQQQVQQGFMDDVMASAQAAGKDGKPEIKVDSEVKVEDVVVDADADDAAGADEDVTEL